MAQDISEENSKEMGPTLKVGMKNIDTSLRSVDFAWNKFYMVVGQATNNVIATLYLSVIHIDTSNYLPSRRVLRPPMADLRDVCGEHSFFAALSRLCLE
jgi:hypothetical protein